MSKIVYPANFDAVCLEALNRFTQLFAGPADLVNIIDAAPDLACFWPKNISRKQKLDAVCGRLRKLSRLNLFITKGSSIVCLPKKLSEWYSERGYTREAAATMKIAMKP